MSIQCGLHSALHCTSRSHKNKSLRSRCRLFRIMYWNLFSIADMWKRRGWNFIHLDRHIHTPRINRHLHSPACECNHLSPAGQWHFRECGKTCWHILRALRVFHEKSAATHFNDILRLLTESGVLVCEDAEFPLKSPMFVLNDIYIYIIICNISLYM